MTTREASRVNHTANDYCAAETVNFGSLQRIADACEKMAATSEKMGANFDALRNERDYLKKRQDELYAQAEAAGRKIAALRGVITKLRKAAR